MLEPSKSAPDYEEQEKERQRQIRENNGFTDWGMTAQAVDMQQSPLATGQIAGGKKAKPTKDEQA